MNGSFVLVGFLWDFLNFILIFFSLFFLNKKNYLDVKDLILYSIFLITPFFFNNILFDWTKFYDQSQYLFNARESRNYILQLGNFFNDSSYDFNDFNTVFFVSILFSIMIPFNLETINSIAFCSKALFIWSLIYINYKEKIPLILKFFFLFSPSVILFSSLSLKDLLIATIMILSFYFLYQNKIYQILIGVILLFYLYLIKFQNFFLVVFAYTFYFFFKYLKKNPRYFVVLFILAPIVLFFQYENILEKILYQINFYRFGFFIEEYGEYKNLATNLTFEEYQLYLNWELVPKVLNAFFAHLFLTAESNNDYYFIFFVNIKLIVNMIFLTIFFFSFYKKNPANTIFWGANLLLSIFLYSLIIFNKMTIIRYEFPLILFYLFCLFLTNKRDSKKSYK
jgi:hypothetical protein